MLRGKSLLPAILLFIGYCVDAQDINLSGEFRINPVYSSGFREPLYQGDKPGFFTMQRTRLMFNYSKKNDLDAEIIFQDRRFWGDQSDRADVANIALYRAWVEKFFGHGLSLRLGRQGFVYDNQFILADPNWVGTRAHDAMLLKYEGKPLKAHLAMAYNANGQELKQEPYEYNMYKTMQFLWLHKDISKLSASFIFLNKGAERQDGTTDIYYTQTFGTDSKLSLTKSLTLKGVYYHQMGRNTNNQEVDAYLYSLQLLFDLNDNISFNLGVDMGSGTNQSEYENPDSKTSNTFDKLYGLHHGQFGYLDYFYLNNPTTVGVQDFYLKSKFKITEKLSVEDHAHSFMTGGKLDDPLQDGQTMDSYMGFENDILISYKVSSMFKTTIGHSIMFGTDTLDQFFGGRTSEDNQVFYAVITATPNFYSNKKEN